MKQKHKKQIKLLYIAGAFVWFYALGYYTGTLNNKPTILRNPVIDVKFNCPEVITPQTPKVERVTPTPHQKTLKVSGNSWQGKVSYYTRAGCLGCSPTLTMANGEPLDDTKLTIAFNKVKLNSMVKITNLDNNKSVVAKVTDTGGFERLGRIADLGLAVKDTIEAKTDTSSILIELLNN